MSETLPWNLPLPRLLAELGSTPEGLSAREVERRLAKYGPNDALLHRRRPLWRQILDRFANPLILILLFASGLSAWTGEVTSFALIVGIILLSVVLDVVQQARAENTVDALRRSVGLKAEVLRDGKVLEVAVDRLVPGDVVELRAGDIVPGDCRLLVARDLYVNQALLTGEAYPAEKHAVDLATPVEQPGQAGNFLCMGTSVISGMATGLIVRTGRSTELGGLAHGLAMERPRDAFERGIRQFGFLMLRLTVFLVLFVTVTNVVFHRPLLELLLFALALAVGLTPELLPMVVTVTLANGARRLAARRVIVKRLAAIHDLGAMDVLCTDKTGTLTADAERIAPREAFIATASRAVYGMHPTLLPAIAAVPRFRGRSSAASRMTGVTVRDHRSDGRLWSDRGQVEVPIARTRRRRRYDRLAEAHVNLVRDTGAPDRGAIRVADPQDGKRASSWPKRTPLDGIINWETARPTSTTGSALRPVRIRERHVARRREGGGLAGSSRRGRERGAGRHDRRAASGRPGRRSVTARSFSKRSRRAASSRSGGTRMSRVLVIAAHPDDEVLGMGGTIAMHAVKRQDAVRIVCVTDGSSTQYPGDAEKRAQKEEEARPRRRSSA